MASFLFITETKAQTAVEPGETPEILKSIEINSNGNVTVDIPSSLLKLIEPVTQEEIKEKPAVNNRPHQGMSGPRQISGYRIQIFSDGRNQQTLEARARARSNSVVSRFPKYRNQVYSFSKAPNWYTRIGNFKTQEEAASALSELQRAFPSFAGEMRVVRSNIFVSD